MKNFMLKRLIEHLLDSAILAGQLDQSIAKRISDVADDVMKIQEKSIKSVAQAEELVKCDNELKELING